MAASCFSGSAVSFISISMDCVRAFTAIPASTIPVTPRCRTKPARASTASTAVMPPAKASSAVSVTPPPKNRIAAAAPADAPDDTPMISGAARGF